MPYTDRLLNWMQTVSCVIIIKSLEITFTFSARFRAQSGLLWLQNAESRQTVIGTCACRISKVSLFLHQIAESSSWLGSVWFTISGMNEMVDFTVITSIPRMPSCAWLTQPSEIEFPLSDCNRQGPLPCSTLSANQTLTELWNFKYHSLLIPESFEIHVSTPTGWDRNPSVSSLHVSLLSGSIRTLLGWWIFCNWA